MSNPEQSRALNRRQFLGRISGGAIGTSLGLALTGEGAPATPSTSQLEKRNEQPGMTYRPLGRTNLNVSRLSFGTNRLSDDRLAVLEMAVERGVNLIHISRSYGRGRAMAALGKFLKKPGIRDKVWIALKGEHARGLPESIDDQLRVLNTDHVDIICSPLLKPDQVRTQERERERFEVLKEAGKVRFLNLTTHTTLQPVMEAGLDAGWFDVILSVIDMSNAGQFQPTIERANKLNVGIMAMKTARGGEKDHEKIARAVFAAGATLILKSLTTPQEVDAWVGAVTKVAQEPSALARDYQLAAAGVCTLCGICEQCPNGVAIQDIVRDYTYYYQEQGLREIAAERYAELRPSETFPSCRDCGRCEERCPMRVPVRRIIREAHEKLAASA